MKLQGIIIFVSCFVATAFAQNDQEFDKECPVPLPDGILNFNEEKYAGKWYEIKRYENKLITRDCGYISYQLKNTEFEISYLTTNLGDKSNTTDIMKLQRVIKNKNNGKYHIIKNNIKEDIPYEVLDTDYENYSIVWGCHFKSDNKHFQRLFIYSRSKALNEETTKKINAKLDQFQLKKEKLKIVEQSDDKCGRNTGASIIIPTMLTFLFVTLLSKQI